MGSLLSVVCNLSVTKQGSVNTLIVTVGATPAHGDTVRSASCFVRNEWPRYQPAAYHNTRKVIILNSKINYFFKIHLLKLFISKLTFKLCSIGNNTWTADDLRELSRKWYEENICS